MMAPKGTVTFSTSTGATFCRFCAKNRTTPRTAYVVNRLGEIAFDDEERGSAFAAAGLSRATESSLLFESFGRGRCCV